MRRNVPFMSLRGSAPTLLEVNAQELLRKPIGQIALLNLLDLLALSELSQCPASLRSDLAGFAGRIGREVSDIPNGESFEEFVEELSDVDAHRVPRAFREILSVELNRPERIAGSGRELLESWRADEPEAFEIGGAPAPVTRLEEAPDEDEVEARATRARKAPKKRIVIRSDAEIERAKWIEEICISRLSEASDSGLGEHVLVAGVRHRAKERYPAIQPVDILAVLRDLKATGRVRYSAGRWSFAARW